MMRLADLDGCFEGAIPSIIATCTAEGTPNVSYLSHVVKVDEDHVALSNQFFGKTAENVRANPRVTILLVDGRTGRQFRVGGLFVETRTEGPLFDRVAAQLAATAAQVGMAGVMKLKGVDVFRVLELDAPPSPVAVDAIISAPPSLTGLSGAVLQISDAYDIGAAAEAALYAMTGLLGADAAMLLMRDKPRDALVTILSTGYDRGGAGADVPFGQGVIGTAAAQGRVVRVGDLSRVRRMSAAVRSGSETEDQSRTIALPGLPGALSQMAIPLRMGDDLTGVLFAEARRRLAFGPAEEAAALILARQLAAGMRLLEADPPEFAAALIPVIAASDGPRLRVTRYVYDDSLFIDDTYIIKGVAGRLLAFLIERHLAEGRIEFTNREIRLASVLRLPEYRDNLETRLLLLRRRLDEKVAPIRLVSAGRGKVQLQMSGRPELRVEGPDGT